MKDQTSEVFRDGKIVKFQQYTDTAQFKEVVAG
jgi:ketosteroid isomerase-like protein